MKNSLTTGLIYVWCKITVIEVITVLFDLCHCFSTSGGSTSSGSTSAGEKCDLSPHGSIENLYEFIKTEAPTPPTGDKKHFYDPVVENPVTLRPPSMTGSEVGGEFIVNFYCINKNLV